MIQENSDIWGEVLTGTSVQSENINNLGNDEYCKRAELQEYIHHAQKDWGFWNDDPNIGWKVHVNLAPENASEVSGFFINQDYEHKFLSGGEIDSGKIFTLYTGSILQTNTIVDEIDQHIGKLLLTGVAVGEKPFDQGGKILGRFCGDENVFRLKRCIQGICLVRYSEDVEVARKKAEELYGKYFEN